jgi:hypothetical protein
VHNFHESLTCFTKPSDPRACGAYFRGSPAEWSNGDGETVVKAMLDAKANPKILPVDKKKLAKRPPVFVSRDDTLVTVPETSEPESSHDGGAQPEIADHTRIQAELFRLGSEMGFGDRRAVLYAAAHAKSKTAARFCCPFFCAENLS